MCCDRCVSPMRELCANVPPRAFVIVFMWFVVGYHDGLGSLTGTPCDLLVSFVLFVGEKVISIMVSLTQRKGGVNVFYACLLATRRQRSMLQPML